MNQIYKLKYYFDYFWPFFNALSRQINRYIEICHIQMTLFECSKIQVKSPWILGPFRDPSEDWPETLYLRQTCCQALSFEMCQNWPFAFISENLPKKVKRIHFPVFELRWQDENHQKFILIFHFIRDAQTNLEHWIIRDKSYVTYHMSHTISYVL